MWGRPWPRGSARAGHDIRFASRDPKEPVPDAAAWADVVILAVPWKAHGSVAQAAGKAMDGKTVIDVSNVLTPSYELAMGCTTSGAEELQKMIPQARVVKAFNTVFAQNMKTGKVDGQPLTALAAGDDAGSRKEVLELAKDIGFDPVDAGSLKSARYLEPLGVLNITLGYGLKMGRDIGFKLVRVTGP